MQVFTIVESPIIGDPLGALREQEAQEASYNHQLQSFCEQMGREPTSAEHDQMYYDVFDSFGSNAQVVFMDSPQDLEEFLKKFFQG